MCFPLALLPGSILADILDSVPALYVYQLVFLAGDRNLASKVFQNGLTSISIGPSAVGKIDLKLLSNFRRLQHVSIHHWNFRGLNLHTLPHTLTSLIICCPCINWMYVDADPSFKKHPENVLFHEGGKTAFNFGRHFPHLKQLILCCTSNQFCGDDCSLLYLSVLVTRFLPPSLETLGLSHIYTIHQSLFAVWPSQLTLIVLEKHFDPAKIALLKLLRPDVRIQRYMIHSGAPTLNYCKKALAKATSGILPNLRLHAPSTLTSLSITLYNHPSVNLSQLITFFPCLTHFSSPAIPMCIPHNLELPPGLVSIECAGISLNADQLYNSLIYDEKSIKEGRMNINQVIIDSIKLRLHPVQLHITDFHVSGAERLCGVQMGDGAIGYSLTTRLCPRISVNSPLFNEFTFSRRIALKSNPPVISRLLTHLTIDQGLSVAARFGKCLP